MVLNAGVSFLRTGPCQIRKKKYKGPSDYYATSESEMKN